jgi:hypothetical protein
MVCNQLNELNKCIDTRSLFWAKCVTEYARRPTDLLLVRKYYRKNVLRFSKQPPQNGCAYVALQKTLKYRRPLFVEVDQNRDVFNSPVDGKERAVDWIRSPPTDQPNRACPLSSPRSRG